MKIAAYCRVSTEKDEQLESLEHQKEFFVEYAKKYGHELYRLYADEGITGTSLKKRTEFKRLMEDAKYKLFDMVVVKDISRFARNTVDFLQSIRALKSMGIETVFLTANMTSLGDSEFILTIFGAMAQEESANLSKRVKWGKNINAKKGRVPQRIYGYDRIDNFTLRINEEEAAIVREIFRMYIDEGLGCRLISIRLNQMGVRTKFDCDWNPRAVRRVLEKPTYCGHYINHKYEIEDYLTGKQVHIPEDQHYHHLRPEWAIVSEETFAKAKEIMDSRREQYKNISPRHLQGRHSTRNIFSTLIKCEGCGRSFVRKTHTYVNTYHYWVCATNYHFTAEHCHNKKKFREDLLLDSLKEYLSNKISDREAFISEVVEEYSKSVKLESDCKSDPEDIKVKIKQLETKKNKYQEMYANEIITMSELKKKIDPIKRSISELEAELSGASAVEQKVIDAEAAAKKYFEQVESFLNMKNITNIDMRKIIDHATVSMSGELKIYLKKAETIDKIF